jgi:hypothetical protein
MCVLKLTLGKIIFLLLVWSVRTDMFLRPNALGSVDLLSENMPSGRVCTTSGHEPFAFFARHTTFCLFYHVVLCAFSLRFLLRYRYSPCILSQSQVFSLTFLILLSFGSFQNIGIFDWLEWWFKRLCIFFCLYVGWILLHLCPLDCYIYFCISLCIQLIAVIIPHSFWTNRI